MMSIINIERTLIENFISKSPFNPKSRSVELYNPSAYTGMFIRKFEVAPFYTRINTTASLYNQLYVTGKYDTRGSKSQLFKKNSINAPWNIPDVYPHKNRREMLV